MVNVRRGTAPNIKLVISTSTSKTNQELSQEDFRQLANSIMEEFPEEDNESASDDEDDNNGPTFTYPGSRGASKETADEPWKPILNLLLANNTRVLKLLDYVGVNPDVNSVIDFYYSEFEPSSDRHSDWNRLEAFNTLLSDERFASVCLHNEFLST